MRSRADEAILQTAASGCKTSAANWAMAKLPAPGIMDSGTYATAMFRPPTRAMCNARVALQTGKPRSLSENSKGSRAWGLHGERKARGGGDVFAHRRRRATQRSSCNPHAPFGFRLGRGICFVGAPRRCAPTSPASRRLASAPSKPGTRPLPILGQAPSVAFNGSPREETLSHSRPIWTIIVFFKAAVNMNIRLGYQVRHFPLLSARSSLIQRLRTAPFGMRFSGTAFSESDRDNRLHLRSRAPERKGKSG